MQVQPFRCVDVRAHCKKMEGVPLNQRKSLRPKKTKKSNDEIDPDEVDTSPLKVGTRVESNFEGRHVDILNYLQNAFGYRLYTYRNITIDV